MTRPAPGVRARIALASAGSLHLGSARLALLNWLLARGQGGAVVLRLADAGQHREPAGHAEQDLDWLGLDCEETVRPGERLDRYAEAAEALKRAGRLYPCLESDEELRAKRDWRVRRGKSPIYDRAMLKLTAAQLASAEAGGKRPHWRFRLSDGVVAWNDLVLGPTEVKVGALSDPVAIQADGTPLRGFTSVVDDFDSAITHFVRGADHVDRSGLQLDMLAALGGDPGALRLAHVPQLGDGGNGRAKFEGLTLRRLRSDGVEPAAITAYLAALGSGRAARVARLSDLAAGFDLKACARGTPSFDIAALQALNRLVLRDTPFADVAARLPAGATEAFWTAVRGGIDLLGEAPGWWDVVAGTIVPPVIEGEATLLRTALALLPPEPWDDAVWRTWSAALARATSRNVPSLVEPLRLALTGEDHGPDLAALLPLIGATRVALRLQLAAA